MIRAVALEVGPVGIRVNNINPGVIDTPMLQAHGDAIRGPLAERAALKRLGAAEDIADAAVWLCSDGARFSVSRSQVHAEPQFASVRVYGGRVDAISLDHVRSAQLCADRPQSLRWYLSSRFS